MVEEIKSLLRKADAYDLMFDELITPAIEKAVAQELPFSVNLTSERLGQSARRIAPQSGYRRRSRRRWMRSLPIS